MHNMGKKINDLIDAREELEEQFLLRAGITQREFYQAAFCLPCSREESEARFPLRAQYEKMEFYRRIKKLKDREAQNQVTTSNADTEITERVQTRGLVRGYNELEIKGLVRGYKMSFNEPVDEAIKIHEVKYGALSDGTVSKIQEMKEGIANYVYESPLNNNPVNNNMELASASNSSGRQIS